MGQKRVRAAAAPPGEPDEVYVPEVYTDGSYALEGWGRGYAGHRVWFGPRDPRNMAQPLEGSVQTVNRAELSACIAVCCVAGGHTPLPASTVAKRKRTHQRRDAVQTRTGGRPA